MAFIMVIHTCDKCGIEIQGPALERVSIHVSIGIGSGVELCKSCATPLIHFLKRSHLLEDELARRGLLQTSPPHVQLSE
jgi:hypothetical protein